MRKPSFIAIAGLLVLLTPPVHAQCVSVPETRDSHYVGNARQQMLCQHGQISGTVTGIGDKARFDDLARSMQRLQLQRRFDNLPAIPRLGTVK